MQFQRRSTNELLKRKFSIITAKTEPGQNVIQNVLFTMKLMIQLFENIFFFNFLLNLANKLVMNSFNCVKIQNANEIQKVVEIITEEGQNNFPNLLL